MRMSALQVGQVFQTLTQYVCAPHRGAGSWLASSRACRSGEVHSSTISPARIMVQFNIGRQRID